MKKLGVFFIYVLFLPTLLFSNEYIRAHVERVVDGDTFVVRLDNEIKTVKIWGVEAPERRQYYGVNAKLKLLSLIQKKDVKIRVVEQADKLIIGEVFLDDRENLAEKLLSEGYLWWDRKGGNSRYEIFEENAKFRRVGLWRNKHAVAPWDFRAKVPEKIELER